MVIKTPQYVLGVDLDGVTACYEDGLRSYMLTQGFTEDQLPVATSYNFLDAGWPFKDFDDYMDHHIDFVKRGGFLSLKPMENASTTLNKLVEEGVKVRIVTHRLLRNGTYAQSIADTVRWLDLNNIPFHDFCAISQKSAVDTHLLIDDAPTNVEGVRQSGGYVAVFDQPYNRHLDGPRVNNWNEIYDFVTNHREALGI